MTNNLTRPTTVHTFFFSKESGSSSNWVGTSTKQIVLWTVTQSLWRLAHRRPGHPDTLLAFLSYTRVLPSHWGDRHDLVELHLPRAASAWFEPSLVQQWKVMFERSTLFEARRHRGSDSARDRYADAYLYVDVEAPLRDIFNFLQCLIPDMLVIIRVDDLDDHGEKETTQRLPSSKWVEDYGKELYPVFGEDRFESVVQASQKHQSISKMVSWYNYEDEDEDNRDFTACDKECGYCGRCDY